MKKQDLKQIIREEIRKVLKEAIMSFSYAKPFEGSQSELTKIKSELDAYIKQLQDKNYSARPGENALYFPNFGKYFPRYKTFGPTIAVRIGDTMFLKPIGSNTIVKIAEDFIARLLHNDNMEGYLIPGEN